VTESSKNHRANIWKLQGFAFFQMFLIIIPVIVPFWKQEGLTLTQVFQLQGLFGFCLILFDAPAGYVADLFGRKPAMVIGSIIVALGFQVLWVGHSFFDFAVYECALGLGISLQSGCDVAILYATLEKKDEGVPSAVYVGRRLMWQTLGEGTAALFGGWLALISLRTVAQAQAITSWLPVVFALWIQEPPGTRLARNSHVQNLKMIGRALFGHSRLLTLTILNFIVYGFATYCAVWCLQPYWESRGWSVSAFGYLWAANSFAIAVIASRANAIEKYLGARKTLIIIALMPILGYAILPEVGAIAGLAAILAFPVCRGLSQVFFQDAVNTRVPPEIRATTNSIGSLGTRMLFLIFGPLLGHVIETGGINRAFETMALIYIGAGLLLALPLYRELRKRTLVKSE
jgi:MFS family permease